MSLLEKIFGSCREPDEPTEDPKEDLEAPTQMFEYTIEVRLLFWGNQTHYEVVTVQGIDEEQARLEGYYRVLDRFPQGIYAEASVLSCRKLGSDDV